MHTYYLAEPVHFPHIDMGGVLYHGRYLDYLDKARQAILRQHGISLADLFKADTALVVVETNQRYMRPVTLEQTLHIYTRIVDNTSKLAVFSQAVLAQPATAEDLNKNLEQLPHLMHMATVKVVCISLKSMKATAFPPFMKAALDPPPTV